MPQKQTISTIEFYPPYPSRKAPVESTTRLVRITFGDGTALELDLRQFIKALTLYQNSLLEEARMRAKLSTVN